MGDIESLVELRVANATAHIALEPDAYRVPDRAAVRRHFAAVLGGAEGGDAILVAELAGRVAGMVEVLRDPLPPDHQILRPRPSAPIHTVVAAEARGRGVGTALLAAAEEWAATRGIVHVSAGIHHANAGAVRFYGRHGYADSGVSLVQRVSG